MAAETAGGTATPVDPPPDDGERAGRTIPRAGFSWDTGLAALAVAGICILEVSGTYDVVTALTGLPLYIMTLAGTTLVAAAVFLRNRTLVTAPVIGYGLMVLATVVSYQRSQLNPEVTVPGVSETMKNFVFVLALAALTARVVPWRTLAMGFTISTGLIGYLSGINEFLLGRSASFLGYDTVTTYEGVGFDEGRHAGPMPDPNFWGRELVAVIPFAVAMLIDAWRSRHHAPRRALAQAVVGVWGLLGQLIAVYLTGSRGTYLSLAAGVLLVALAAGLRLRTVLLATAVATPVALLVPGVASRIFSFDLSQAGLSQSAAVDGSVLERLATQRVALAMASHNIVSGVGPDGYFTAFGRYGAVTQQALPRVVAPHNLYLGTTAELGLLGLGAWIITIGTAVWLAARASRRYRSPESPYAAAVLAGLVAWSAASIFLHASHLRIALALAVFAAAAERHTRGHASEPLAVVRRVRGWVWLRPAVGWSALAAGLVAAVAAGGGLVVHGGGYQATTTGHLVPQSDNIYLLDLRTRTAVTTTYAVMHEVGEQNKVDVQGEPQSGLLRLTAAAATGPEARSLAGGAIDSGHVLAQRSVLARLYTSAWSPITVRRVPASVSSVLTAAAAGFALGAGTVLAVARWRWRRRSLSGR